jgi:hypothetical protein
MQLLALAEGHERLAMGDADGLQKPTLSRSCPY